MSSLKECVCCLVYRPRDFLSSKSEVICSVMLVSVFLALQTVKKPRPVAYDFPPWPMSLPGEVVGHRIEKMLR